MSKVATVGFLASLVIHKLAVATPTLGDATVRMGLAVGLMFAVIPLVREWAESFVEA